MRDRLNFSGTMFNLSELFLLLPWLERKERDDPTAISAAERKVLELVRQYASPLLMGEDKDDKSKQIAKDSPSKNKKDEESVAKKPKQLEQTEEITGLELKKRLLELASYIPDLMDPDVLLQKSGFTLQQQSALVGQFGGRDLDSTARNMAWYLDGRSTPHVREFFAALDAVQDL